MASLGCATGYARNSSCGALRRIGFRDVFGHGVQENHEEHDDAKSRDWSFLHASDAEEEYVGPDKPADEVADSEKDEGFESPRTTHGSS